MAAGEALGLLANNIAVRPALQARCFAAIGLFMQMRSILAGQSSAQLCGLCLFGWPLTVQFTHTGG